MDGIGNEVTQKIRAAIKSKLVELSAYVDDELPDYIMVMIANKKSKEQMTHDLSLFLGDTTESFTGWLEQVLNQLQNITSEPKHKPKEVKIKDTEEERPVPPPEVAAPVPTVSPSAALPLVEPRSEPDDEVLALKADTEADDDFREDLRCSVDQPVTKQSIPLIRPFPRVAAPESEPPKARSASTKVPASKRSGVPSSTVGAVVRRKPQFISDDEDEEYDPSNPSVGSVASVVKVSERRSSVPENMQANRLLVIKAMKDAHASVTSTAKKNPSARVEPYEPTPISKQTMTKKKRPAEESLPQVNREEDCVPPKRPALRSIKDRLKMPPGPSAAVKKEPPNVAVVKSIPVLEETVEEDSDLLEIAVQREDVHTVVKDASPSTYGRSVTDTARSVTDTTGNEVDSPREESWPHFVVTLNGVDPSNFKVANRDVVSVDGQDLDELPLDADDELILEEDDYIPEEEGVDMEATQACLQVAKPTVSVAEEPMEHAETHVEKSKEKCRYWPACKNGDQCPFQHPTVPCKAFPNCKYKEKCLFIHPNCKYDAFCKRRDCPYTHASRRNFSCPPPVASSPSLKHCRFYPHCNNKKCSYFHPKPCKFGASCQAATCPYTHEQNIPSPDKLKWSATAKKVVSTAS